MMHYYNEIQRVIISSIYCENNTQTSYITVTGIQQIYVQAYVTKKLPAHEKQIGRNTRRAHSLNQKTILECKLLPGSTEKLLWKLPIQRMASVQEMTQISENKIPNKNEQKYYKTK